MLLEEKLHSIRMQKGECIDPFLSRLQENRDQLTVVGSATQATKMVRLALNLVSKDYQVFVRSILGKENLSNWESMWVALQQEEKRRDFLKCQLEGSNSSGRKMKEEEDNVALASKGQQEQHMRKKVISKIKFF